MHAKVHMRALAQPLFPSLPLLVCVCSRPGLLGTVQGHPGARSRGWWWFVGGGKGGGGGRGRGAMAPHPHGPTHCRRSPSPWRRTATPLPTWRCRSLPWQSPSHPRRGGEGPWSRTAVSPTQCRALRARGVWCFAHARARPRPALLSRQVFEFGDMQWSLWDRWILEGDMTVGEVRVTVPGGHWRGHRAPGTHPSAHLAVPSCAHTPCARQVLEWFRAKGLEAYSIRCGACVIACARSRVRGL